MESNESDPVPDYFGERMFWRQVRWGLLVVMLTGLAYGGFVAYEAIRVSTEAELNLHAVLAATNALQDFIRKEGRWPKSVQELSAIAFSDHGSMFHWPRDRKQILERAQMTFGCDLKVIGEQNPENFPQVTWQGTIYRESARRHIGDLIETAREKLKELSENGS